MSISIIRGVAKKCNLVSVKISNTTNWSFSALIDCMDWAPNDMIISNRTEKSVVNVPGGGSTSTAVDNAVLAAYRKGMTLIAAAGNCNRVSNWISPAGANGAIVVASVDRERRRAALSNCGPSEFCKHCSAFWSSLVLVLMVTKASACLHRAKTHSRLG